MDQDAIPLEGARKGRLLSLLPALLLISLAGCSESPTFSQPIAYNHHKHIEEAGLSCFDCHARVLTHQKASIPNIEVCKDCHAEAMTESPEEKKVVGYIERNQRIPWKQVHRVPDYAYFSHRRHVTLGKVACQDCHGDVNRMTLPFTRPHTPITMEFCIDCHEKKRVTIECSACHR